MSIKSQLQQQLWQAIGRVGTLSTAAELTPPTIPLHRLSTPNYVCYRSAIALKLSSPWQQTPLDIARQLTVALLTLSQESGDAIAIDFTVEVLPPGWILFRLSDRALATYLQEWFKIPPFSSVSRHYLKQKLQEKGGAGDREKLGQNQPDSDKIFPVQYIHARCCSLLQLADEQGLIQVKDQVETYHGTFVGAKHSRPDISVVSQIPNANASPNPPPIAPDISVVSQIPNANASPNPPPIARQLPMVIISPNPIPWLQEAGESDRESIHLRLTHPAEWDLIVQLLDLLDAMSASDSRRWVKQGLTVSQAYEQFYKSCRIWGDVKNYNLPLAQARLGLIGVTQVVLRSLLEKLGVSAPRAF
ncbi:DALR anticodon-binding domain-containing protein [Coleofasciculus sp. G2-EDA-02]|uniref:DALR anticodon-binding domain-containing protein n=1 Tax=Coleofasciculus sp. G2-EDA-02 TaxID=3069529 RepID=UPI0032FC4737